MSKEDLRKGESLKETSTTLFKFFRICQILLALFVYLFYNLVMNKFLSGSFIFLLLTGIPAFAEETSDIDAQINSLYAANKLDDTFNLILTIPQDKRTAKQWMLMGNVMMDYEKTEDAMFMYNAAVKADPKFYKAYYNLGNVYLSNNQPNLAIENYKLATKYNKEFAPAYYNMGCAYLKLNDLKKAKGAFHDAIYFKPTEADYHYNLAYVYKALGKEKTAKVYLNNYNKIKNNY